MLQMGIAPDPNALKVSKAEPSEVKKDEPRATARVSLALDKLKDSMREEGDMPSFRGLTLRQAIKKYNELGLREELAVSGSGFVKAQSPKAGTKLADGVVLKLELAP